MIEDEEPVVAVVAMSTHTHILRLMVFYISSAKSHSEVWITHRQGVLSAGASGG